MGRTVLANTVDDRRRSALHFACAVDAPDIVDLLINAGAEVDATDADGYTPLHMAAGYLNAACVRRLIAAEAETEVPDKDGRTPVDLVDDLRRKYAAVKDPALLQRRMSLEDVARTLVEATYEEVAPVAVLDARVVPGTATPEAVLKERAEKEKKQKKAAAKAAKKGARGGREALQDAAAAAAASVYDADRGEREFLVAYPDTPAELLEMARRGVLQVALDPDAAARDVDAEADANVAAAALAAGKRPPEWIHERHVAAEVQRDWDEGLEYADAEAVLDVRRSSKGKAAGREFLVRWADAGVGGGGASSSAETEKESWVPESYLSPDLVVLFEAEQEGRDPVAAWQEWASGRAMDARLAEEQRRAERAGAESAAAAAGRMQQIAAGGGGQMAGGGRDEDGARGSTSAPSRTCRLAPRSRPLVAVAAARLPPYSPVTKATGSADKPTDRCCGTT